MKKNVKQKAVKCQDSVGKVFLNQCLFLNFIYKNKLKGHCLIFLSAIYQLFIEYFNIKYIVVFYRQKEWNNNKIPKHIAKYAKKCIHDNYRISWWLPINLGYCRLDGVV